MRYTLAEIAALTGGELLGADRSVSRVVTDSRTVFAVDETLFVALRGSNHDGHAYILELYRRGVRAFLVDAPIDTAAFPDAGFVRCGQSLRALQRWASAHRARFRGRMVAITGSNGKTTTKEWIAQLAPLGVKLFRSPKSYNSQLGVALSLLMMEGDEEVAVIEAGISQPGEMDALERMICPEIGILTNIGSAHQAHFSSMQEKLEEKMILFRSASTLIYPLNDPLIVSYIEQTPTHCRAIGVTPERYDLAGAPFQDAASRDNLTETLALFEVLGYELSPIVARLPHLQRVAMRLEQREGTEGCKIVNDSYNSDITSLSIALDYLESVGGEQEKLLILSDIPQSGIAPESLYAQVAALLQEKGVDRLIGIGEELECSADLFSGRKEFYRTTEAFLAHHTRGDFRNLSILIKGGRAFNFEKISRALEQKTHTTVLEVDLDRMIHNLNYFRARLQPEVGVMAMVKAFGYGHGGYEVANMLERQGVAYLAVAFADEGVALREAGITMPIVVLNADSDSFDLMVEYRLEPEIYSFTSLHAFAAAARREGEQHYPIHLKIDTGMHRLGFMPDEITKVIAFLNHQDLLTVSTLFTHLAASDEPRHDEFTRKQVTVFQQTVDQLKHAFPQWRIRSHASNSAAIERFPEAQFDLVRLGIGLYGVSSVAPEELQPVATLKSRIVQIKELPAGETVGYGRRGELHHPTRIATIPIGYADGLNRHLSRGAWSFLVNGTLAPIIGNICMDTCMIDITEVEAKEGDEVIIFGDQPTIIEMAETLGTIPYEIMTGISARVKRIYLKE